MQPTIFFGADVSHPEGGDRSSPSIAAVVASVDMGPSRYIGFDHFQPHRKETIENLADLVKDCLLQFFRSTR